MDMLGPYGPVYQGAWQEVPGYRGGLLLLFGLFVFDVDYSKSHVGVC